MEIRVDVKGVSCHGSAPERGDNAIYKMADILQDVRALNENDAEDATEIKVSIMLDEAYNPEWEEARFLGRGTVTASEIFFTSPSRCAVADSCSVSLDRRMTAGETWESCLDEIRALPSVQKYGDDVTVSMYHYDRPSYTGTGLSNRMLLPRPGSFQKITKLRKHWKKPTKDSTEKKESDLQKPSRCEKHVH